MVTGCGPTRLHIRVQVSLPILGLVARQFVGWSPASSKVRRPLVLWLLARLALARSDCSRVGLLRSVGSLSAHVCSRMRLAACWHPGMCSTISSDDPARWALAAITWTRPTGPKKQVRFHISGRGSASHPRAQTPHGDGTTAEQLLHSYCTVTAQLLHSYCTVTA